MGLGTHEKYLRLAESLADRFVFPERVWLLNPAGAGHEEPGVRC